MTRIAKVRNASNKYEIVEKIGKGAYGNVHEIINAIIPALC